MAAVDQSLKEYWTFTQLLILGCEGDQVRKEVALGAPNVMGPAWGEMPAQLLPSSAGSVATIPGDTAWSMFRHPAGHSSAWILLQARARVQWGRDQILEWNSGYHTWGMMGFHGSLMLPIRQLKVSSELCWQREEVREPSVKFSSPPTPIIFIMVHK